MKKVALFVSGNGGFGKILYKNIHLIANCDLALVIADRACGAYDFFAEFTDVPAVLLDYKLYPNREGFENAIYKELENHNIGYIFLNYNRLIGQTILDRYENRIVNLHLSLLPLFKGFGAVEGAFNSDMLIYGATTHLVDASVDGGSILGQAFVARNPKDDIAIFTDKLFRRAAVLLLDTVYKMLNNELVKKERECYFDDAKYGDFPFNPSLSIKSENIIF